MPREQTSSNRLIAAVRTIALARREEIENLKRQAADWGSSPDFLWEALLLSMATMGNSRGVRLFREEQFHAQVRWQALAQMDPRARRRQIGNALQAAGVRMWTKKAEWLNENFSRILAEGGPDAAKCVLERQPGRDAKIAFLKSFRGIGSKYARNMMMDAYHPEFRESIAIDQRINNISVQLGVNFSNYQEAEKFYLDVAHAADLNGWELDRLLYNFNDEILAMLEGKSSHTSRKPERDNPQARSATRRGSYLP